MDGSEQRLPKDEGNIPSNRCRKAGLKIMRDPSSGGHLGDGSPVTSFKSAAQEL
jgi:hypothetical protein